MLPRGFVLSELPVLFIAGDAGPVNLDLEGMRLLGQICAASAWPRSLERRQQTIGAWDSELFTHVPEYVDGFLMIPDRPGRGTEPNEEAMRAHPANPCSYGGGLITYGRKEP